jgi:hypothetical protein
MTRTNTYEATGAVKRGSLILIPGIYPLIPPMWPNREVRRAVKQNKTSRIPAPWLHVMAVTKGLRAAIKAL